MPLTSEDFADDYTGDAVLDLLGRLLKDRAVVNAPLAPRRAMPGENGKEFFVAAMQNALRRTDHKCTAIPINTVTGYDVSSPGHWLSCVVSSTENAIVIVDSKRRFPNHDIGRHEISGKDDDILKEENCTDKKLREIIGYVYDFLSAKSPKPKLIVLNVDQQAEGDITACGPLMVDNTERIILRLGDVLDESKPLKEILFDASEEGADRQWRQRGYARMCRESQEAEYSKLLGPPEAESGPERHAHIDLDLEDEPFDIEFLAGRWWSRCKYALGQLQGKQQAAYEDNSWGPTQKRRGRVVLGLLVAMLVTVLVVAVLVVFCFYLLPAILAAAAFSVISVGFALSTTLPGYVGIIACAATVLASIGIFGLGLAIRKWSINAWNKRSLKKDHAEKTQELKRVWKYDFATLSADCDVAKATLLKVFTEAPKTAMDMIVGVWQGSPKWEPKEFHRFDVPGERAAVEPNPRLAIQLIDALIQNATMSQPGSAGAAEGQAAKNLAACLSHLVNHPPSDYSDRVKKPLDTDVEPQDYHGMEDRQDQVALVGVIANRLLAHQAGREAVSSVNPITLENVVEAMDKKARSKFLGIFKTAKKMERADAAQEAREETPVKACCGLPENQPIPRGFPQSLMEFMQHVAQESLAQKVRGLMQDHAAYWRTVSDDDLRATFKQIKMIRALAPKQANKLDRVHGIIGIMLRDDHGRYSENQAYCFIKMLIDRYKHRRRGRKKATIRKMLQWTLETVSYSSGFDDRGDRCRALVSRLARDMLKLTDMGKSDGMVAGNKDTSGAHILIRMLQKIRRLPGIKKDYYPMPDLIDRNKWVDFVVSFKDGAGQKREALKYFYALYRQHDMDEEAEEMLAFVLWKSCQDGDGTLNIGTLKSQVTEYLKSIGQFSTFLTRPALFRLVLGASKRILEGGTDNTADVLARISESYEDKISRPHWIVKWQFESAFQAVQLYDVPPLLPSDRGSLNADPAGEDDRASAAAVARATNYRPMPARTVDAAQQASSAAGDAAGTGGIGGRPAAPGSPASSAVSSAEEGIRRAISDCITIESGKASSIPATEAQLKALYTNHIAPLAGPGQGDEYIKAQLKEAIVYRDNGKGDSKLRSRVLIRALIEAKKEDSGVDITRLLKLLLDVLAAEQPAGVADYVCTVLREVTLDFIQVDLTNFDTVYEDTERMNILLDALVKIREASKRCPLPDPISRHLLQGLIDPTDGPAQDDGTIVQAMMNWYKLYENYPQLEGQREKALAWVFNKGRLLRAQQSLYAVLSSKSRIGEIFLQWFSAIEKVAGEYRVHLADCLLHGYVLYLTKGECKAMGLKVEKDLSDHIADRLSQLHEFISKNENRLSSVAKELFDAKYQGLIKQAQAFLSQSQSPESGTAGGKGEGGPSAASASQYTEMPDVLKKSLRRACSSRFFEQRQGPHYSELPAAPSPVASSAGQGL